MPDWSVSGTSPDGRLVETVELPGRDFHLGAQFHPEFKSRPPTALIPCSRALSPPHSNSASMHSAA